MMTKSSEEELRNDIASYTCGHVPSALTLLRAPMIENWSTSVRRRGMASVLVVSGDVYRRAGFDDGEQIHTSAVAWFDRKRRFVRTMN